MKVKIKTWDRLRSEYGPADDMGTVLIFTPGVTFTRPMEAALPSDRLIEVEQIGFDLFKWHVEDGDYLITDQVIAEYLDDEEPATGAEIVDQLIGPEPKPTWDNDEDCPLTPPSCNGGDSCECQFVEPASLLSDNPPMDLVDLNFVAAMSLNMQRGIKGDRVRDGWRDMPWDAETQSLYRSKLLRHVKDRDWAAVACNAMILFVRGEVK
jgi:hypothetical protein